MKRIAIISILLCLIGSQVSITAQNQRPKRPDPEQLTQSAAEKMAKELALDDETTRKFSEVYKAYLTEKSAIMQGYRGLRDQNPQELNDESAAEKIVKGFERRQKQIEIEQKLLNLDIQYCEKFNKVLNPKQILRIYERPGIGNRPHNGPNGGRPQARNFQEERQGSNGWPGSGWDNEF